MKKFLLTFLFVFAALAAPAAEDRFDKVVRGLREYSEAQGYTLRVDKEKRAIFLEIRLPFDSEGLSQNMLDAFKPLMIKNFKDKAEKDRINALKEIDVTLHYILVTTDGKIFKIVVTPDDLLEKSAPAR
ncbi:MAG: hypothetical protein J6Y54_09560 [Lentisphaeria bacterium]|jgi:hypothetical protein|nr:hypothetical protein [Lentisphaeria bacterium]